jgi:hypothetical protein
VLTVFESNPPQKGLAAPRSSGLFLRPLLPGVAGYLVPLPSPSLSVHVCRPVRAEASSDVVHFLLSSALVTDFIDPDVDKRLADLEREEDELQAKAALEVSSTILLVLALSRCTVLW